MKPLAIFSTKQPQPCERSLSWLSWSRLQSRQLLRSNRRKKLVLVRRGLLVGRNALNAIRIAANVNSRFYLSIILILVAAPVVSVSYTFFDMTATVSGWYYVNAYYLGMVLCPHISMVAIYTGIFCLFPSGSRRAYFLAIPTGLTLSRIYWLIAATSNEDFHAVATLDFYAVGILSALVWLFAFNYLIDRKYHKYDGIICRIIGALRIGRNDIALSEATKLRDFDKNY